VAAHQENIAKHPLKAQTGWSFETDHPGRALLTFDGRVHPSYLGRGLSYGMFWESLSPGQPSLQPY